MKLFRNNVIRDDIRRDKIFVVTEVMLIALMVVALMFFILVQRNWVEDSEKKNRHAETFMEGWERVYPDGTREQISIPSTIKGVEANETVVLEATLPAVISNKHYFSTRANAQSVKIYVGRELRCSFRQTFDYFYWEDYVSKYIYAPIASADCGKTIRIEATALTETDRVFSEMYIGERSDIDFEYVKPQFFEIILAFTLFMTGFMVAIVGIVFRFGAGSKMKVDYLGWSMMIVAIWVLTQCNFRDFILANIVGTAAVPSIALSLFPMTLAMYLNTLQNDRYRVLYIVFINTCVVIAVIHVILALLRIRSFNRDLPLIFFLQELLLALFIYTVINDRRSGLLEEYKEVFIGMLFLGFFATAQSISYFILDEVRGINFVIGFSVFTACALMHSVKYLLKVEEGKRKAEMEAMVKSDFLATMSHEIRTPINAVLGMNQAILRDSTEENILNYASDVDGAGKMLLSIINDILDFSKIDSGKMDIVEAEYSLRGLVATCTNLIDKRAMDKGLTLVVDVDKDLPSKLYGDEVRIQQIVINLLSNAVKYTKKGQIGFKLFGEPASPGHINLKIHVSDTGMGIREEDKDKLFKAFGRLDRTKNKGIEGTGLGLAISGRLVDLMGGTIRVESTYGSGSVFMVSIPQGIASEEKVGEMTLERAVKHEVHKVQKDLFTAPSARILVVDDVLVNLKVVQSLLKKTGMTIDTCTSGDEALEKVSKVKYDVILLDHMMPDKDGVETYHEMKQMVDNPNADTPVVMLTANAVAGAKDEYLKEGFDDYISKPFSVEGIQTVLKKLLPPEKVGKSGSYEILEKNVENIEIVEEQKKIPENEEDTESIADFINLEDALSNCGRDRSLLEAKLKEFALKDKRAALSESFENEELLKYKEYLRVIRVDSMDIGAEALGDAALKIESLIMEHDKNLLGALHRKFVDDYSRLINVIMREMQD